MLNDGKVRQLLKDGKPGKVADRESLYLIVKAKDRGAWRGQYCVPGRKSKSGGRAFTTHYVGGAPAMSLDDARYKWATFKRGAAVVVPATADNAPELAAKPVPAPGKSYGDAVADYTMEMCASKRPWRGGVTGTYAGLYAADTKAILPDGRALATYTAPEITDDLISGYCRTLSTERKAKDTAVRIRAVREFMRTNKTNAPEPKRHHKSLPWQQVPAFYAKLAKLDSDARARALAFVIQTGIRIGDALGTRDKPPATWGEIVGDMWHLPGNVVNHDGTVTEGRSKNRDPQFIPITPAAFALLGERGAPDAPLFATDYFKVNRLFEKLAADAANIHGFRTSFRVWMLEHNIDKDTAEMVLQHRIGGDRTAKAYLHTVLPMLVSERREIMEKWAAYVTGAK